MTYSTLQPLHIATGVSVMTIELVFDHDQAAVRLKVPVHDPTDQHCVIQMAKGSITAYAFHCPSRNRWPGKQCFIHSEKLKLDQIPCAL